MEAAIDSAGVLISFGALLGKVSPLQLLFMALMETPIIVANAEFGYGSLKVADAGDELIM